MATELLPIPEPPGLPLIGNAPIPGLGGKIRASDLADKHGKQANKASRLQVRMLKVECRSDISVATG